MSENQNPVGTQAVICDPLKPVLISENANVEFHKLLPVHEFEVSLSQPWELGGAEVQGSGLNIYAALDLVYEQQWQFRELELGDIDTTLSLAPQEELVVKVKRTQREFLKRTHIDQRESINSLENSIQDRDVVAVTRSSAKQFNWSVNAQAGVDLKKFDFGATAAASGQINNANSSSLESVHDATLKSSRQLTLMSKVEIVSEKETIFEDEVTRKLKNPYRDRSVDFHVYRLYKSYDVRTQFDPAKVRPVIAIEFDSLDFDNAFVRNNLTFLQEHLIEDQLLEEYAIILRENIDDIAHRYESETQVRAEIAMEYLFSQFNMYGFDFPDAPDEFNFQTINQSFVTPTGPGDHDEWNRTALQRTLNIPGATEIYTTVAFFHRIYRDIHNGTNTVSYEAVPEGLVLPDNPALFVTEARTIHLGTADDRKNLVIDLAVSLTQTLQSQLGKLTPEAIHDLCNVTHRNEIWRRLFGCVAFLQGAVFPQLEEDEERAIASRRFGALETRIARHLNDYAAHYTERYLEYLTNKTRNVELLRLLRTQLTHLSQTQGLPDLGVMSLHFDLEAAFVSSNRLIVPAYGNVGLDDALQLIGETLGVDVPDTFDLERQDRDECIRLPHDGVHIEPMAGLCQLLDVPEPKSSGKCDLSFSCGSEKA